MVLSAFCRGSGCDVSGGPERLSCKERAVSGDDDASRSGSDRVGVVASATWSALEHQRQLSAMVGQMSRFISQSCGWHCSRKRLAVVCSARGQVASSSLGLFGQWVARCDVLSFSRACFQRSWMRKVLRTALASRTATGTPSCGSSAALAAAASTFSFFGMPQWL